MLELAKQIRHSLQHCPLKWHFAFWTFFFKTTFHIENGKVVHISTFLKSVHVLKSTGFLVKKVLDKVDKWWDHHLSLSPKGKKAEECLWNSKTKDGIKLLVKHWKPSLIYTGYQLIAGGMHMVTVLMTHSTAEPISQSNLPCVITFYSEQHLEMQMLQNRIL